MKKIPNSLKTPVVKCHTTLPLPSSFSIVIVGRLPVVCTLSIRLIDYVVSYTAKLSLNERLLPRNYHQSLSCDIYGQLSLFSLQEVAFVTMGVFREKDSPKVRFKVNRLLGRPLMSSLSRASRTAFDPHTLIKSVLGPR